MTTVARILKPALAEYAKELLAAGFKVYLPASDIKRVANGGMEAVGRWFKFSRVVDGQTCYAMVQEDLLNHTFSMPIKPSRENGSSMFVGGPNDDKFDLLDLATAKRYASPSNHNYLVGTQKNYAETTFPNSYEEVTA